MKQESIPGVALARRLRALRERHWPELGITQSQLARALSAEKPVSVPLISSWESGSNPKPPPESRLAAYATFFATARSVERRPFRLLDVDDLTAEEHATRDTLLRELTDLRAVALQAHPEGVWRFPEGEPAVIICSEVPERYRKRMPYAEPDDPDHIEMYAFADLDALIELHGHLRAVNPRSRIDFKIAPQLTPDDYSAHLVLLGGVDWNVATRELLERIDLPIRQASRPYGEEDFNEAVFEVIDDDQRYRFAPVLKKQGDRPILYEDVAHFFRAPNPFNRKRTITICNGMFGRGVLGAVRTLTDARFRERNEAYLASRFTGRDTYSVLARALVVAGKVVTPDWTNPEIRLHEWSRAAG